VKTSGGRKVVMTGRQPSGGIPLPEDVEGGWKKEEPADKSAYEKMSRRVAGDDHVSPETNEKGQDPQEESKTVMLLKE
jgi:hypothetical protein